MKLGFIRPDYPYEKRIALLPEHINNFENDIVIESGFGDYLGIKDRDYQKKGCSILSRDGIFETCDFLFSLKLIQESDYKRLRKGMFILGWTHPNGSGRKFFNEVAVPLGLTIVDLDNIYPSVYRNDKKVLIDWIPKNFVYKNSYNAGMSAVLHAFSAYGTLPQPESNIAILGCGNVSQGALGFLAKFGCNVRMFYRKTMNEFIDNIGFYDYIINGIEVDQEGQHIINANDLSRVKKGCLIIDAAADAGNAIETTRYTSIGEPLYVENDIYFYVVNNAPSVLFRQASFDISKSFSHYIYAPALEKFKELF